jgi:hypothetical protein
MLMIHSPAGTEGMFSAVHALAQEQLMDANLAAALALKHDTVMIEQSKYGAARGRTRPLSMCRVRTGRYLCACIRKS